MRLIDADALKEEINKKKVVGRFNTLLLIVNAPTVSDRYDEGYVDGLKEGQKTNCITVGIAGDSQR